MKQTMGDVITKIVYDDIPVQVYMDKVINRLNSTHAISFKELLHNTNGKVEIIGVFLALLELVRLKKIKLEQFQDFDEIRVSANEN
jgi:segregation and condensation protein A